MAEDPKRDRLPEPPRLPQRAAIYIAPDGSVHFGALFEGLLPVAHALTNSNPNPTEIPNEVEHTNANEIPNGNPNPNPNE